MSHTRHSEAPDALHFWTGVSVVAGALRRRVWMDELYFQWTPNFYIILVGPPGVVTKSTSINIGHRILREVNNIHFGPNSVTWQALIKAFERAQEIVPMGDVESFKKEGFTIDSSGVAMACITCAISELGTFLKPKDDDLVDVITDLWDGQTGSWEKATSTQGCSSIENPWINVIGATTPAWLRRNFPEYLIGGGLTSRCIFVFADKKRQLVSYPSEVVQVAEFKKEEQFLVEDLCTIAEMKGEYHRTPEATEWGEAWYKDHWNKRPAHMASDRYGGYIARKQTHIHKLAMVLAASQNSELIVRAEDLQTAATLVTALETDMMKVFESVGVADNSDKVREVIAVVRVFKEISQKELYRNVMNRVGGIKQFEEVVSSAERAGYIKKVQKGGQFIYSPTVE